MMHRGSMISTPSNDAGKFDGHVANLLVDGRVSSKVGRGRACGIASVLMDTSMASEMYWFSGLR